MFVEEAPVEAPAGGLEALPLEHLEHQICQLASHLASGMARWLDLLGEYDARDGWWSWDGLRSVADWVAWRCALDPRSAREHVRVARALRELPETRRAFSAGQLSFSKVRALTRVAEPDSEGRLLELARHATAAQLERMLGAFRRLTSAEAEDAHRRRYLHHSWDEDGCLRINARLTAEQGALFLAALEAARGSLREAEFEAGGSSSATGSLENGSAEPENQPEYRELGSADALAALAETALAQGSTPLSGPERHQLTVQVDLEALLSDEAGCVHLRDGPALAPETARRLGCDSAILSSLERAGEVLTVGRRTRAVPSAIRRALELRDGGCRFPGCNNRRWVDAHHIRHWAAGGETRLENLILLCRRHHRLLHEGGYTVEGSPSGELSFRSRRGRVIANAPPLPSGDRRALEADSGPLLTGSGERMDFRSCVDAVFAATGRG